MDVPSTPQAGDTEVSRVITPPLLEQSTCSSMSTDSSVATPPDEPVMECDKEENHHEKQDLKKLKDKAVADYEAMVDHSRVQRLKFLLEKSTLYAQFLAKKMEEQQQQQRERVAHDLETAANQVLEDAEDAEPTAPTRRSKRTGTQNDPQTESPTKTIGKKKTGGVKRKAIDDSNYNIADYLDVQELSKRRKMDDDGVEIISVDNVSVESEMNKKKPLPSTRQPALVTGGRLREYQLAGFEWLVSLYDNGLNGILADEMGLGKTLQTIAFFAYLWERKIHGPFLVVAPLSTLANWYNEFKRFTPILPALLYHGTPEERSHMRNKHFKKFDESFPVVITSYEIVMNDRKYLQKFKWKYIVVDEGHRIKNLNCKLIKELKSYSSANRLLLTGTPLQNNLAELWSLLNFLLPDIFDDWENFQTWFDFSALKEKNGEKKILEEEQENFIISNLHQILKPFLLRRLKCDVEYNLPKKREYLLYAPITKKQKEIYDAIINKEIRQFLISQHANSFNKTDHITEDEQHDNSSEKKIAEDDQAFDDKTPARVLRAKEKISYQEISDQEFFQKLDQKASKSEKEKKMTDSEKGMVRATKEINSKRLQNAVMQLRKVCNHPYLFDWPVDPKTMEQKVDEGLTTNSGKMLLLDRLLPALFERGHKVLIFSQFTTSLDILHDWAEELKGWSVCRIDGSVKQEDRREQIELFNTNPDVKLFILSTRAGGLGINLTAADSVIIFDSDWNPQMDLQAQDRVHRIGQTKPVIIYRLVTANTVESAILEKANAKRKLEKLVIHKGKFKAPSRAETVKSSLGELAELLNSEDQEKVQFFREGDLVIPDDELERVLDRSDKAYEKAEKGIEEGGTTFKILKEDRSEQNDALAKISRDDNSF